MADNEKKVATGAEINTDPVNDAIDQDVSGNNVLSDPNHGNGPVPAVNSGSHDRVNDNGKEVTGSAIGYKNLVPVTERSKEEARAISAKGGKASGESRRQRKAAKEIAQAILSATMRDDQIDDVLDGAKSLLGEDKSAYAVLIAKMVQEGLSGNVNAFTAVRDTAGDKPTDKQEVTAAVTAGDLALMGKIGARLGLDDGK